MKTQIFTSLLVLSGSIFMKTNAQCNANFQTSVTGCTVNFTNTSQGNSTSNWNWNFGDNQTGNVQNPSHTYAASGTYVVCLQFSSPSCNGTYCTSVTVNCTSTGMEAFDKNDLALSFQNPFSSSTLVSYSIPGNGNVEVALFDLIGNKISVPASGNKSAGTHSFNLVSGGLAKGVYLLRMNFEGIVLTKKIVIAD